MEMNFRSYQQACAGMLEAKDKKQYLKNHADKLIKLFKKRDNDDFFYWKFCHEVYHLTEYCLFNVNVKRICKEPKLAKLHDLAKYDKELYHMGEVVYLDKYKDRMCCRGDDGYKLRLEIQHIHEKYYPRSHRNCYKLYSKYASYVLDMKKDDFTKKEFFDTGAGSGMGYQMYRVVNKCGGKITPDRESIIYLYTNYEEAMSQIKKEMVIKGLKF